MRAVKSRREKVACDDLYREAASAEGQGAACGWAGGSAVGAVAHSQFRFPASAPGPDPREPLPCALPAWDRTGLRPSPAVEVRPRWEVGSAAPSFLYK